MQYAATPGLWTVSNPRLVSGRVFDNSLVSEGVAVIGMNVSRSVGISNLSEPAVIFHNGIRFSVIGIFSKSQGPSAPLSSITIPAKVAKQYFGALGTSATMTIQTGVGAARVVSEQRPAAIDPATRSPKGRRLWPNGAGEGL